MNLKRIIGNKKSHLCDFSNRGNETTQPSHINDATNIEINIETAIANLEKLKEKYKNAIKLDNFLFDVRDALGLPNTGKTSKYGMVTFGDKEISVRLSNHNTKAYNYIKFNANKDFNISIIVNKKKIKKTFEPNDKVKLEEFV